MIVLSHSDLHRLIKPVIGLPRSVDLSPSYPAHPAEEGWTGHHPSHWQPTNPSWVVRILHPNPMTQTLWLGPWQRFIENYASIRIPFRGHVRRGTPYGAFIVCCFRSLEMVFLSENRGLYNPLARAFSLEDVSGSIISAFWAQASCELGVLWSLYAHCPLRA